MEKVAEWFYLVLGIATGFQSRSPHAINVVFGDLGEVLQDFAHADLFEDPVLVAHRFQILAMAANRNRDAV